MPRGTLRAKRAEKGLVSKERIHSDDGVDLTLIRWMLSLTPVERLQVLERHIASVQRLRGDKT
jgi:hypothetical protein